ncbi:unnamed protein product [Microthlaspi erraticum]|uniref:Uncharacterized protein n=1 Tax=Microthlaspi erraticum TaxID=1685480 RepID=A0A6D2J4Y5_9BRAS|nr:unnamed protein product [Microthlaspi erraticum]
MWRIGLSEDEFHKGRLYFVCARHEGPCHLSKWWEESVMEEVSKLSYKIKEETQKVRVAMQEAAASNNFEVMCVTMEEMKDDIQLSSGGGFMSFGPAVQKIRRFWLDSTHQLDRPVSNSIELLFQESKSNPKNVASL